MVICLAIIALMLTLLSALNVVQAPHLWLWKLSVLTSEVGVIFAMLTLFTVGLGLTFGDKRFIVLIPVALVFAWPSWQAARIRPLHSADAITAMEPRLSWLELLGIRARIRRQTYERLTFKTPEGVSHYYDFYRNPASSRVIVFIHGGGWESGDTQQLPDLLWFMVGQGWNVLSLTYRKTPYFQWPVQRNDLEDSLRHAQTFLSQLDWKRWVVAGRSAGGQLAGEICYRQTKDLLSPSGCILLYAPTDLEMGYEVGGEDDILASRGLLRRYLGGTPADHRDVYREASPVFLANSQSPPTLLLHGQVDPLTWYKHSERLFERLKSAGVRCHYILFPGATHGFEWTLHGPSGQITRKAIAAFANSVAPE